MIQVKRLYAPSAPADGKRVLVDRLWPRGIAKETDAFDEWEKDAAPSFDLRTWFSHAPEKWAEFQVKYLVELERATEATDRLRAWAAEGDMTLLYAARDEEHNHAIVLRDFLNAAGPA